MDLNDEALILLETAGVSAREWSQHYFGCDEWGGDQCGCPDDRCVGHHHGADEPCGCFRSLLRSYQRGEVS